MMNDKHEDREWRMANGGVGKMRGGEGCGLRGEGAPQIRRRPQMGSGERGEEFWICDCRFWIGELAQIIFPLSRSASPRLRVNFNGLMPAKP